MEYTQESASVLFCSPVEEMWVSNFDLCQSEELGEEECDGPGTPVEPFSRKIGQRSPALQIDILDGSAFASDQIKVPMADGACLGEPHFLGYPDSESRRMPQLGGPVRRAEATRQRYFETQAEPREHVSAVRPARDQVHTSDSQSDHPDFPAHIAQL